MQNTFLAGRVLVKVGDITREDTDAIVNAANSTLLGGGGVDGAIHRTGGPAILEECRTIRSQSFPSGLPPGEAVITTGGRLQARYVIHTVGPIYGRNGSRDAELLASCYRSSLELAAARSLTSIAFPAISTGVYGYPRAEAAAVSSAAIRDFLAAESVVAEVRLVFHNTDDELVFLENQRFDR